MRVIPVLDVRRGQAVHAVAGRRDHYGPLRSVLHPGTDPITLARAGSDIWALPELYLADLDAILGEAPPNFAMFGAIAGQGLDLWVDAGIRGRGEAGRLVESGVKRVIVGLETIEGPGELAAIVAEVGSDHVAFSLDLHQGRPLVETLPAWGTDRPTEIAGRAIACGARCLIHLDLARVGTGQGVAFSNFPFREGVEWIIGGGVAGIDDLRRLQEAGFAGVLVGSALHDGRIGRRDLRSLSRD